MTVQSHGRGMAKLVRTQVSPKSIWLILDVDHVLELLCEVCAILLFITSGKSFAIYYVLLYDCVMY